MFEEFQSSCSDEVTIKLLGKIALEFEEFSSLEQQIKLRQVIDQVLYSYQIATKETALVASDVEEKARMFLAIKKLDGMSSKTLYNYQLKLSKFANFMRKPLSTITTMDLRMYLAVLNENLKASSMNTEIACLKSFFSWLVNEEYIIKNPCSKIKGTKIPKRLRKALNAEELEMLKQACKSIREKALIEFLSSSGCRLSEIVGINKEDINWNERSLYVIGKGNKQRKIYFSVKAKILLKNYLDSRKDTSDALFVSSKRPCARLGGRSIERELKNIATRAGFSKSIFPHLMRHTFATLSLNSGMSLVTLQHLLGHEEPSTTQIYAAMSEENIKHEYNKLG